MPCPTVTTPGSFTHADPEQAIKNAIIIARQRATLVCKAAAEACAEVVREPKNVELVKGAFDANNNPVFEIEIKATFHCGSRPGCWFFWWPVLAGGDTSPDDPDMVARLIEEAGEAA